MMNSLFFEEGETADEYLDRVGDGEVYYDVATDVTDESGQGKVRFFTPVQSRVSSPLFVRVITDDLREAVAVDIEEGASVIGESVTVTVVDVTRRRV
jgi:predicted phage-related endonuclease